VSKRLTRIASFTNLAAPPIRQKIQRPKQRRAFQNKNAANGKLGGHLTLSTFVNNN
jgi:hypothetical protein